MSWRGQERTELWEKKVSPFPRASTADGVPPQAGSYRQKDKHEEDMLNHFPLGSQLQSKWPDREAKVLIDHLVSMMEH